MNKAEVIRPIIKIKESNDGSYFDLNYTYETDESSITENEVRAALILVIHSLRNQGRLSFLMVMR